MSQVQIVPDKKTGAVVAAYQSNPEFGYVQLQQTSMSIDGGWLRESKRSTLLRGEVSLLTRLVASNKTLSLPGNIVVKEYLESEVPAEMIERFLNKNEDYDQAIEPYIKRAGADGVELTKEGERIVRFAIYDGSGKDTDIKVAHDNVEAVRMQKASVPAQAQLGA